MRFIGRSIFCSVVIASLLYAGRHISLPSLNSLSLSGGLVSAASSSDKLALHYSPLENLEQLDTSIIRQSRDHLDIAAYAFTDRAIAEAVADVARNGVHVRIYRDNSQYAQEQERDRYISELFRNTPNIEIRVKRSRVLMHLKAYCNGDILRDGSSNFSPSGTKQQSNSLVLMKQPDNIKAFEAYFNAMWSQRDNIVIQ